MKRVEDPRRFGVAMLGADGRVERLMEKPAAMENNLAVVGTYFFPSSADLVKAIQRQMEKGVTLGGEYYLADAINLMLSDGLQMRAEEVSQWEDCGKPETLLHANRYLLEHGLLDDPDKPYKTTWKDFLKSHWESLAACDFLTVATC